MRSLRALIARSGLSVVFFSLAAFGIGFSSYTIAHAVPDSTVTPTLSDQNNPNPATFTDGLPGQVSITSTSAQVYVSGTGTLVSVPLGGTNGWAKAWYGQDVACIITCEYPTAKWVLDAECGLWLLAKGQGVDGILTVDDYRAETTGTMEMKGDFNEFWEAQVVVDTMNNAASWESYDAEGGGKKPTKYPKGGTLWLDEGPDTCTYPMWIGVAGEKRGKRMDFFMYVRGNQYMYAQGGPPVVAPDGTIIDNGSLDTKLDTEISAYVNDDGTSFTGWKGTATSYYWDDGAQRWVRINIHTLPHGLKL